MTSSQNYSLMHITKPMRRPLVTGPMLAPQPHEPWAEMWLGPPAVLGLGFFPRPLCLGLHYSSLCSEGLCLSGTLSFSSNLDQVLFLKNLKETSWRRAQHFFFPFSKPWSAIKEWLYLYDIKCDTATIFGMLLLLSVHPTKSKTLEEIYSGHFCIVSM